MCVFRSVLASEADPDAVVSLHAEGAAVGADDAWHNVCWLDVVVGQNM